MPGAGQGVDLLLVLAPPWGTVEPPPLGAAYVVAAARRAGLEVAFADLNALLYRALGDEARHGDRCRRAFGLPALKSPRDLWTPGNQGRWGRVPAERFVGAIEDELAPFYARVAGLRPAAIGFSIYGANLFTALALAKELRARFPAPRIVFGGPWTGMWLHRKLLRGSPVAAAVLGEGEEALAPVLAHLLRGEPLPPAANAERFGDVLLARPAPVDLGREAVPDYSAFETADYPPGWFSLLTTRGCPKRCFFCSDTNVAPFRKRRLDLVAEELAMLRDRHGLSSLTFRDQMIDADPRHLRAVCRWMIENGCAVPWEANLSVLPAVDEETLDLMRASGCRAVKLGLESGADAVLAAMGKRFTTAQASAWIRALAARGIEVWLNLIVGYLGETEEDFAATRRFVADHAEFLGGVESVNALELSFGARLWERRGEVEFADFELAQLSWTWRDNAPALRERRRAALVHAVADLGLRSGGGIGQSNLAPLAPPLARGRFGEVDWVFTRGRLQLAWRGEAITEALGLFFDCDDGGRRTFGYDLDWAAAGDGGIRADADGLAWELSFAPTDNGLALSLAATSDRPRVLDRVKVNLVLDDRYAAWAIAGRRGESPAWGDWRKAWTVEGPRDSAGNLPLADGFRWDGERRFALPGADGFPALAFAADDAAFLPVVQGNCYPGVAVGFYRTAGLAITPARPVAWRFRVEAAGDAR